MGIRLPRRDPQAATRVERHLHRVDELRKLFFRGEELDLQSVSNRHLLDGLCAIEEDVRSARTFARLVGQCVDERRCVTIVNFQVFASSGSPYAPVAVPGHDVEHSRFALKHFVVRRQDVFLGNAGHLIGVDVARVSANERQERAIAIGGEAVGRPVAQEPVAVLVDDRLA